MSLCSYFVGTLLLCCTAFSYAQATDSGRGAENAPQCRTFWQGQRQPNRIAIIGMQHWLAVLTVVTVLVFCKYAGHTFQEELFSHLQRLNNSTYVLLHR